jgi:hypothetical protein
LLADFISDEEQRSRAQYHAGLLENLNNDQRARQRLYTKDMELQLGIFDFLVLLSKKVVLMIFVVL